MMKHTILCVDDEIDNVEALERLFRKKYKVLKATSGQEGLALLGENRDSVSVILTDQRMPTMTGAEMLEKSIQLAPKASRLLLTGYTDLDSVVEAVNKGQIHRYLTKPWDPVDLQQTVDQAVEKFNLGRELETKNSELESALRELQTLDQAKSQFMILINHELKTPLTSIINFLGLLSETDLSQEQKSYVSRIQKSSDRLQSLIEDVLLLMRAETHQLRLNKSEVRFAKILQDLPASLQESLNKKNQKIALDLQVDQIRSDFFLISESLYRLLHNASKFGSENSSILVKTLDLGTQKRISISNEGSQFDLVKVQKLMEPFFLDESILHHSVGTGLGLSISQALLKNINSNLEFINTDGHAIVGFTLTDS